jgi:putative DNA primase/helicase
MRVSAGSYKQVSQADGATAYLHRLTGEGKAVPDVGTLRPPAARADTDLVHRAYEFLLAALGLSWTSPRRVALRARGLSDDSINRARYCDFPGGKPRWEVARTLFHRFGEAALGVPGLVVRTGQKGPYLTLAGPPGLLIPVRGPDGRIAALKIRRDEPGPGGSRYVYLTSASKNWAGPKAADALHVPLGTDLAGRVVRITEGPLKADVCVARGDLPTVAIPSAGGWKRALDLLAGVPQVTEVRVALDADFRTNPVVARGVRDLLTAVTDTGRTARLEVWDPAKAKGIDDALAAGVAVTALDPDESRRVAAEAFTALQDTGESDGRGPGGPPESSSAGAGPNKAIDDPFELARGFLRERHTAPTGEHTLRFFREDWYRWADGAWLVQAKDEVRGALARFVERVFDQDNAAQLQDWAEKKSDKPPRTARKVTTRLIGDVVQALVALTIIPAEVEPPAHLDGQPGPDRGTTLFARNGVVDLAALVAGRTDYLTSPSPTLFNTSALPFDFCPDPPAATEWLRFVLGLWPDDPDSVATLQEWFGYCLTADTSLQKLLLVVGPARSGKGTLARVLTDLVGRANTAAPTLGSLAERFGLWPLVGKSLAVIGDAHLSGRADAAVITERLKSITGEDLQTVDRKNREPIEVRLGVRFLILTNEVPKLRDASAVIASRLVVLRTTRSHLGAEDLTLAERLAKELPGILAWSIQGWQRLRERGRFLQPAAGAAVLAQLRALAAEVAAFAAECCQLGPGLAIPKTELFAAWRAWCEANGRRDAGTLNAFSRDLFAAFPDVAEDRPRDGIERVRRYTGITLDPARRTGV